MYLNEKNITGDLPQVKFIFLPSYTKTIMCFNSEPAKMHSKCSVMVIVQQNQLFLGERLGHRVKVTAMKHPKITSYLNFTFIF